jgi:hypothetical protein
MLSRREGKQRTEGSICTYRQTKTMYKRIINRRRSSRKRVIISSLGRTEVPAEEEKEAG